MEHNLPQGKSSPPKVSDEDHDIDGRNQSGDSPTIPYSSYTYLYDCYVYGILANAFVSDGVIHSLHILLCKMVSVKWYLIASTF